MSTPPPVPPDPPEVPGIPPLPLETPPVPPEVPAIPPVPGGEDPAGFAPVMPPVPGNEVPEVFRSALPPDRIPQSWPPVVSPQSTPGSGTKALLLGCAGAALLALLIAGAGLWWVGGKVKGVMKAPVKFAAELILSQHPDLELVRVDEETKQVTIKNRQTGETTTLSLRDLEQGKFSVKSSDGRSVEMGEGGIRSRDKEGNETVVGAGAAMPLPDWVPAWPGEHTVMLSTRKSDPDRQTGRMAFTVAGSMEEAAASYQNRLEGAGFTVEREETAAGAGKHFQLKASSGPATAPRTVQVQFLPQAKGTLVTLEYASGPAAP